MFDVGVRESKRDRRNPGEWRADPSFLGPRVEYKGTPESDPGASHVTVLESGEDTSVIACRGVTSNLYFALRQFHAMFHACAELR